MLPLVLFIPLINSHTNDFELRYALRSWAKYSTINRVLIIGHKPMWYTGDHIPYYKLQPKTKDIFEKVKYAASVHDQFIFANDDHILLQPLIELPYYYQGLLSEFRGGSETFMRYVNNTAALCPGGKYFDVHTPMVVTAERMAGLNYVRDTIFKSQYCYGMEGVPYKDCKINQHLRTEEIRARLEGLPMFSFGDNGLSPDMKRFLTTLFPDPSPWESP